MKKLYHSVVSLVLSVLMVFTFTLNGVEIHAESVQLVDTIVLFAQFEDTQTYNFMESYTDSIISMCNDTSTLKSLKSYINAISYGQTDVQCYFPQLQDGVIVPYQLTQAKEDYQNSEMVAFEVLSKVTVPSDIPMDANGDGVIDNVILVIDGKAQSGDDILWPCAFYLNGVTINGLYTGYVNIQNSYSLFENIITGGVGVLSHEFLHSLNYPDLYRNSTRSGVPVGLWDVMASDSVFLQYPLAYQRATISHWLEPTQVTKDGTYTITSVSQSSGDRLYILKTPFSDTELFAIEYRVKGSSYNPYELDSKIYGSGLVIYRVNTEVDGNHKSDSDEIYVFRPDDTTLDGGQGDIYHSYYGGDGCPNEIGSLNFEDGLSEGALVYSDGTNSGIKISDITLNGDEATFNIQFADTSNAELWTTTYSTTERYTSLDMATFDGVPYILTSNGEYANVNYLQDGAWVTLDGSIGTGKYSSINEAKLLMCNGVPYVLFNDYSYNLQLYGYDKFNSTWELKYSTSEMSQYTDFSTYGDSIYIAYTVGSYPYALNVMQYDTLTGSVNTIVESLSSNACNVSISCNGGEVLVAYRDLSSNSVPKVSTYDGNHWETITLSNEACSTLSTAVDGETFTIAVVGNTDKVYQISNGDVIQLGVPTDLESSIFDMELSVENGETYLSVNTQNDGDLSVYRLDGSTWTKLGNSLAKEVVNFPCVVSAEGTVYTGYVSSSGTLNVKAYTVSQSTTSPEVVDGDKLGDINLDGNVDSLDVIILKKHLIEVTTLESSQFTLADLNSDGLVNVFDLILLKKLL